MTTLRRLFADRTLWIMGGFGFAAGLPLPLSGLTLRQWLSEGGTSLAAIGFTASIGLAYTLKFLWSPLLDQLRPPVMARFGRRRGWLLVIQPLLALACVAFALSDPGQTPVLLVSAAVLIAFLSASQDIVVDAWRIETFPERMQGIALAAYVWGYRMALLVAGAGAIGLANTLGWRGSLLCMAALAGASTFITLAAAEPPDLAGRPSGSLTARLHSAVVEPFRDLLRRPGVWAILAFVALFNLGDALGYTMAPAFYRSLGFDRVQVAAAIGIPGLAATLAGAAAGGWLVFRLGMGRALVLTGFLQMATLGLYFLLAVSGANLAVLVTKVVLETFADAMAATALASYLSALCSARFTATQYALLSSVAAVASRTVASYSGRMVEELGWIWFYAFTIVAAAPAMLIMLWLLRRYPAEKAPLPAATP